MSAWNGPARVLALLLLAACAETDDGSLEGSQVDETGGSSGSTSSGGNGAAAGTSSTGGSATGGSATGGSGTGGSGTLCNPGATEPCACPGGVTGARRCADTGMGFEGCDCSGQGGSGQGGSGQGGAQGGSAQGGSAQGGSAQGGSAQGGSAQGGSGQGGSGTLCTPGQQISCACPGGSQGAQACLMDGSGYGPCMCNGSGGAGQGGSGQGGSSQGGSSSGGTGSGSNVTADSSAETCPGQTLDLSSLPVTVTGDTSANSNDYSGHCSYPGASTDVVFHFIAPSTGTLNITLDPTGFDSVVYVRTSDCVSGSRECATGAVGSGMSEQLTLSVVQGTSYYIHVDGWTGGFNGPYVLTIS